MSQVKAFKSLVKSAAYIFAIKLFPALANLAVIIVFSRKLVQADYGHYQNFWVRLLVFATIACAGIPVFLLTYPPSGIKAIYRSLKTRHFVFYGFWLCGCSLAFALVEKQIGLSFALCFAMVFFYAANAVQEALLISAKAFTPVALVNFIFAAYFISVHLFVVDTGYDMQKLLLLVLAGFVARTIIFSFTTRFAYKSLSYHLQSLSLETSRKLWIHMGFYDTTQILFSWIDKFVVSFFLSAGISAIYFNGSQNIPILPLLLGAFGSAGLIELASGTGNEKHDAARLMYLSSRLLSCIVFPVFFFLLFFRVELFTAILSDKYLPSVPVFLVCLLVLPLRAYNFTSILQHLHQGAIINKGAVLDLAIGLLLMYPLYQWLGLMGIALSFVVSTYVQVCYYVFQLVRLLNMSLMDMFPFANLFGKFVVFLAFFASLHLVAARFSAEYVLAAGAGAVILAVIILLFLEIKAIKHLKH